MFLKTHFLLFSSFIYILMSRHMDFRERFLERKRLRALKDQRITILNKYVLKNTEILNDITHYRILKRKSYKSWKKAKAIEKDFRRLLAMNGRKYNYKRDLFWRTWRSMPPVNNETNQIVSYRCNNPIHVNRTDYQSCGMWTIEEQSPPCPYEFFSVISEQNLCGMDYKQYKEVDGVCLKVIKFSDLTATCENPIETQWRFTKMYGVTEKYKDVICKKNEEVCDVFTMYEITPEHAVFWLINSTNHVVYSRIMKPRNRNYICVDDCGYFNPDTRKVTKVDKPLKLDLLVTRKPKKVNRMNIDNTTKKLLNEMNENFTQKDVFLNEILSSVKKRNISNKKSNGMHIPVEEKTVTNDILPIEKPISKSKREKDYIIVSIEQNTLPKGKSRRKRKKQKNLVPEDGITLKPIVTPDLPEKGHKSNEEFLNEELDLSVSYKKQ